MTTSLRFFLVLFALTGLSCSNQARLVQTLSEKSENSYATLRAGEFQRDMGRFVTTRGERRDISIKSYALKGAFDWEKRELNATVEMTFRLLCSCQESYVIDSRVEEIRSITLKSTGQALGFSISNGRDLAIDLSQIPEEIRKRDLTVAIAYRAKSNVRGDGEPSSLVSVDGIAGDPLKTKMVYTYAEPQDASLWMPCLNDPSYRAQFSAELKMPVSQMLISNGDLVRNEVEGGFRWVKYQTRYSIPTYLMAFAQGDLTIATELHGALPVSIVTRSGLRADVHGLLKETIRQIRHFESLLVPYPFEKYMLVLAPEFISGGIEHAGITFVDEGSASQSRLSRDLGLIAHELGHQWFGDLVTVKSWDDLWIKEGMATLLAEESMRPYEDPKVTGRLMGHEFAVTDGEAILDPSLKPDDKYTDGPYGRAAWFYTQLRSILGEEVFWATLRKVLTEYRFQSIGTEEFLEYFRAAGGNALVEKAQRAIKAKALPTFSLERNGGVFHLSIEDKDGALLAPLELAWYSDAGSLENEVVPTATKLSHLVNDVRLLTLDPLDRHPVEAFGNWEKLGEIINPLMVPRNEIQLHRFLSFGGHGHQRAMNGTAAWKVSPTQLRSIYPALNSEYAKYEFLKLSCGIAKKASESTEMVGWKNEITKIFLSPPYLGIPFRSLTAILGDCQGLVSAELFNPLWASIEASPASGDHSELQLSFASLVPKSTAQGVFDLWSKVSLLGPTVRSRIIGLQNLLRQLSAGESYVKPSDQELLAWKRHLLELLTSSRSGKFLAVLIPEIGRLKMVEALPELAKILRSDTYTAWRRAYCAARAISVGNAEAQATFEAAVGSLTTLPVTLQELFKDPTACGERH